MVLHKIIDLEYNTNNGVQSTRFRNIYLKKRIKNIFQLSDHKLGLMHRQLFSLWFDVLGEIFFDVQKVLVQLLVLRCHSHFYSDQLMYIFALSSSTLILQELRWHFGVFGVSPPSPFKCYLPPPPKGIFFWGGGRNPPQKSYPSPTLEESCVRPWLEMELLIISGVAS